MMQTSLNKISLLPLIAMGMIAGVSSANAFTLDSFNVTQTVNTSSVTTNSNTVNDVGNSFVGDRRTVTIQQTGQTIGGAGFQVGINSPQPSLFNLIDNTGAQGNVMVEYFGATGTAPFAPVDFTDGGMSNAFGFDVLGNPAGLYDAIVTVRSVGGSNVTRTADLGGGESFFNFSNFTGVNFTQVEYVKFQFNGVPGVNFTLNLLETAPDPLDPPDPPATTPEPATIFGLLAVAGAGFMRKKCHHS